MNGKINLHCPAGEKTPENIFICLGSQHHLKDLQSCQPVDWIISRKARINDTAVFYLISPVSAVVAVGKITEIPRYEHTSPWREKHFAEISDITVFRAENFITNRRLRDLFPEWRDISQPKTSVAVPPEIVEPFWKLIQTNL